MAKVKRTGKGSVGRKPKGKAKLRRARPLVAAEPPEPAAMDSTESSEPAASMTVVASVTRTVTVVSTDPTSGGAMPVAFAAESVTVAADLASPAADAELFDVVCSVDAVVLSSVDFGVAQSTARKHNKAHPGHDAQPIRQQQ